MKYKKGRKFNCEKCGKEKYIYPSRINSKFCSYKCHSESMKTNTPLNCKVCKKEYYRAKSLVRYRGSGYCSKKCMYSIKRTKNTRGTKTRLWNIFSKYIRTRDKGICFTCGRYAEGSGYHAGHYIPSSVCGFALRYHEMNVHGQCYNCNINLGGYGAMYERKMIAKYGQEEVDNLWKTKNQILTPFSKQKYEEMYDFYKEKLDRELAK